MTTRCSVPCMCRSMLQPNLTFTGATLSSLCQALMPSTGCCFRSWALLMSAFARQLCFEQLAIEYFSLPGRCQILQNSNREQGRALCLRLQRRSHQHQPPADAMTPVHVLLQAVAVFAQQLLPLLRCCRSCTCLRGKLAGYLDTAADKPCTWQLQHPAAAAIARLAVRKHMPFISEPGAGASAV